MLSIAPLAVARASTTFAIATAAVGAAAAVRASDTWVSVSIWIEWLAWTLGTPAVVTIWTTRAEIRSIGISPATTGTASGIKISNRHRVGDDIHIPWGPGASSRSGGCTVHVGARLALTEMRRDVGGASGRGTVGRSMLRIVQGKISHLQTVGHICNILQFTGGGEK